MKDSLSELTLDGFWLMGSFKLDAEVDRRTELSRDDLDAALRAALAVSNTLQLRALQRQHEASDSDRASSSINKCSVKLDYAYNFVSVCYSKRI